MASGQLYLRVSRARRRYTCEECGGAIAKGTVYYRHEPHPMARYHRGEPVRYFCYPCVHGEPHAGPREAPRTEEGQLDLPFGGQAIVRPTRVVVVDITPDLLERLRVDPSLFNKIGPENFEVLVDNRLRAAGMLTVRCGGTYRKDGGIDLIFTPEASAPIPFLGACQVKYHRDAKKRVGPAPVRELRGVLRFPLQCGLIVTNTTFTPDAKWAAEQGEKLVQLRDMEDLRRWIQDDFTDDAEWRQIPKEIQVCPGFRVRIPRPHDMPDG